MRSEPIQAFEIFGYTKLVGERSVERRGVSAAAPQGYALASNCFLNNALLTFTTCSTPVRTVINM